MSIKAIRIRLGLTQAAFAEFIGITKTSVSHYETGMICRDDAEFFSPNEEVDELFAWLLSRVNKAQIPIDFLRRTVDETG